MLSIPLISRTNGSEQRIFRIYLKENWRCCCRVRSDERNMEVYQVQQVSVLGGEARRGEAWRLCWFLSLTAELKIASRVPIPCHSVLHPFPSPPPPPLPSGQNHHHHHHHHHHHYPTILLKYLPSAIDYTTNDASSHSRRRSSPDHVGVAVLRGRSYRSYRDSGFLSARNSPTPASGSSIH